MDWKGRTSGFASALPRQPYRRTREMRMASIIWAMAEAALIAITAAPPIAPMPAIPTSRRYTTVAAWSVGGKHFSSLQVEEVLLLETPDSWEPVIQGIMARASTDRTQLRLISSSRAPVVGAPARQVSEPAAAIAPARLARHQPPSPGLPTHWPGDLPGSCGQPRPIHVETRLPA